MKNSFLDYARAGLRFPIGTDLVLRDHPDAEEILLDGSRLGQVMVEAAERYRCPLALPVMDLTTEKADLLHTFFGVSVEDSLTYHFDGPLTDEEMNRVLSELSRPLTPRLQANVEAVRTVATEGIRMPVGMAIGPFSLMTKLIASPIEPVFMAGMGMTGEDEEEIALVERTLKLATAIILRSLSAQVEAGAKAVFVAEPAANVAYISPNQLEAGSDVFDRLVMTYNRQITDYLHSKGVHLLFHCCGELVSPMLEAFCSLKPSLLSLGSSRNLAEDAKQVPDDIVLYGNLPSKKFYSNNLITVQQVTEMAHQLESAMRDANHPFILGSECDVLSVPGAEEAIKAKVAAMTAS